MIDKHVLVTGGGTGIGAAIARALDVEGARITLTGRRNEPLAALARQLQSAHGLVCDVSSMDAVNRVFELARDEFGPIDILVNNAGAAPTSPFHKLTPADWRRVMAVNLDGVFNCTSAALPDMMQNDWGRVINIASTAAQRGYPYVSAYSAAKHGVLGLTRSLALETATSGITVNAVCPGYTDTDIIRDSVALIMKKTGRTEEQALAEFTRANPQGRLIEPDEVAATTLWLCGDHARSITGQAISVSGGEVM